MSDTDPDTEVGEAIRNPYRPALLFLSWTFIDLILWDSQGSATLVITHKQCCVSESEIRCLFDPRISVCLSKPWIRFPFKCWMWIRIQWIRIRNTVFRKNLYFFLVICGINYNFL